MLKFNLRLVFIIILFFVKNNITSQELPPINAFTTEDYGAENQNWAISQSNNSNFIYVANNIGLLEFNGASWEMYKTPNETIMRSVKSFKDKVFSGFYMDFGFWKKNNVGKLEYSSIVKSKKLSMLEDEQIWNILELEGWLLFKSLQRIYLYNLETEEIRIINAENRIHKLAKVDGVIYFQEDKKGLFKIENGAPKLVSSDLIFKNNILVNLFKKNGKILALTQKNGFFVIDDKKVSKWKLSSDALVDKTIYSAIKLRNNNYLLGSISNGLINLNEDGSLNFKINQRSGLSNNTVLSIFEDNQYNIWLGLDNGINCINNASPFKKYYEKSDYLGTIYTSIVFENILYLGTNQGLFYRDLNSKQPFRLVENTQGQVWSLTILDNTLFCGHDSGTFIINEDTASNVFNDQGTWAFLKVDENIILQGCYDGLYILEKKNKKWGFRNKVKGFDNSSKYLVSKNKNKIFVNHEYKGVFKIQLNKEFTKVIKVENEKTLEKGMHSSILNYQDKIIYASKKGVFIYDENKDDFKRDTIYSKLIDNEGFISARLINNKKKNRLWSFSKDEIKYLTSGKLSSKPKIFSISISESIPKAASGYENILYLENDTYLIGTSNGFIHMDLKSIKKPDDFIIHLNQINSFKLDGQKHKIKLDEENKFHFEENNLEFFFSVPNFNNVTTTRYQYQLLGQNKNWSKPSNKASILFENIPYGKYTFKVRGIIAGKLSTNDAVFEFEINRPWYFSNLFLIIYFLIFLLFLFILHITSKRYYKKQRESLLEKAQKELELKELESSQEIIKINNEKLKSDIENKNRELAISTMNIIKKNEFLNSIKSELTNSEIKENSKVVKIIDENLNNTDDWKLFQEAFNNADKKFLKKMKKKHPNLTPNDLRLCAYLRLNLSSKEIAPLLNISPRSVEVKRYRLRKKMELNHDANLTNYILEI